MVQKILILGVPFFLQQLETKVQQLFEEHVGCSDSNCGELFIKS